VKQVVQTDNPFVPRELKTIEVDTEKKIFRVNGEDFGNGCTGFAIICQRYDRFDIRMEIDTTVVYAAIRDGKLAAERTYTTDVPWFSESNEQPSQIEEAT
jgi:hypothetical protein